MDPNRLAQIIAGDAKLTPNDDGTFSDTIADQKFLIEIKVHDVTEEPTV